MFLRQTLKFALLLALCLPFSACKKEEEHETKIIIVEDDQGEVTMQVGDDSGEPFVAMPMEDLPKIETVTERAQPGIVPESTPEEDAVAEPAPVQALSDLGYTMESPPALLINGQTLDPLCMIGMGWEIEEGTNPRYQVADCRVGEISVEDFPDKPLPPYFVSDSYVDEVYDGEADEVFVSHGFVGYRYIGDYNGHKVLFTVENGGGSGVFTTLALYDLVTANNENGDPTEYLEQVETLIGGDRCLGGVDEAELGTDGVLRYSANVTPFDIMGLGREVNEDDILFSPAADTIPSCAACCYGLAHFENDKFVKLELTDRARENVANHTFTGDEAENAGDCFNRIIKTNLDNDISEFDAEGSEALIREIEHICLGVEEGE